MSAVQKEVPPPPPRDRAVAWSSSQLILTLHSQAGGVYGQASCWPMGVISSASVHLSAGP